MSEILSRLKDLIACLGLNESAFASQLGIPQTTISNMFKRKSDPKGETLKKIVKKFGVSADWLLSGEGEMFREKGALPAERPAKIPLLRQTVSCGNGQEWQDADVVETYIEPFGAFPAMRNAKIHAFRVRGTSMVGAGINDGDIVFFNAGEESLRDDLYVFAFDGAVYCKLLKFDALERKIRIYSLHSSELDKADLIKELPADDSQTSENFHIFGRVLAWLHENRLMYR